MNEPAKTENRWVDVAASDQIADGTAIEVVLGELILAIFRVDGELFALDGMCAHQGGPLAEGQVSAGCVTCPWHGWQYELKTGVQTVNRQPLQQTYEVRQREGRVEVRIDP